MSWTKYHKSGKLQAEVAISLDSYTIIDSYFCLTQTKENYSIEGALKSKYPKPWIASDQDEAA